MEYLIPEAIQKKTEISPVLPPPYRPLELPFSTCLYAEGPFGSFLHQEAGWNGCGIALNHFFIRQPVCLFPYTDPSLILLHFMLQGSFSSQLAGLGMVGLIENFYRMFYVPGGVKHTAWFKQGDYCTMHLYLSRRFLSRLAGRYEEAQQALDGIHQHARKGRSLHAAPIGRRGGTLIQELLTCREPEPGRGLYLESRIWELLLLYMQEAPAVKASVLLPRETERLEAVKDYLTGNLASPHTLASIARQFGMSSSALKRQFKTHFHQGMHDFLRKQRMLRAMELVRETTLPIGEIAILVGYLDFSSFTRAFTRYFGHPPLHFRR